MITVNLAKSRAASEIARQRNFTPSNEEEWNMFLVLYASEISALAQKIAASQAANQEV